MGELKDYSGEYRPDAQFADFSKETLIRLLQNYQRTFVGQWGIINTLNRERMSAEEAWKFDAEFFSRQVKKFAVPLVREAMNIHGNDVLAVLKYLQMAPGGTRKGLYEVDYDIRNNNHVLMTFTRCPSLFYLERHGDDKGIEYLCGPGGVEDLSFDAICSCVNPDMKCRPLKLPPRKSKDDICCIWEFKVEPKP